MLPETLDLSGSCDILVTLTSTALMTAALVGGLVSAIVFEEDLPKNIKKWSNVLVHNRRKRNFVVFGTFLTSCVFMALSVVS